MRWLSLGIVTSLLVVAGCSGAHERVGDGGGLGDAPPPVTCHPGDPAPDYPYCLYVGADHVCGDAALQQTCVDGAWRCPPGTSSGGECWCSGLVVRSAGCTCTPSGWLCETDPVDAGPPTVACAADPSTIIGAPCAYEGETCGDCPMPCNGRCNQVTCTGHTWQRPWLGCPNVSFACGPSTTCSRFSEYCSHTVSDVAGVPDDYRCTPFPEDCASDCSCFGLGSDCMQDHEGAVTVTTGGG